MTKKYKSAYIAFSIISWILCFGICASLIVTALYNKTPDENGLTLEQKLGTILYSGMVSCVIVSVLAIIVKDKIEPTVWMANIILAGYLYGLTLVYIIFAVWFVDTYIIKKLKNTYKNKYQINKEIDNRIG